MQGSGAAPGTIRPLVRSFGCAGFFVWLTIGAIFATFFIGEYLDRPEQQKSFWKAGVTVSCSKKAKKSNSFFSGDLVRWVYFWNRGRNHCFSIPDLQLNSGKVGTGLKLCTEDVFTVLYIIKSIYFRDIESFHLIKPWNNTLSRPWYGSGI